MKPNYPVLRFMAFSSAMYSTEGGFANYVGSTDDLETAQGLALAGDWEEAEVVDRETGAFWFRLNGRWKEGRREGASSGA